MLTIKEHSKELKKTRELQEALQYSQDIYQGIREVLGGYKNRFAHRINREEAIIWAMADLIIEGLRCDDTINSDNITNEVLRISNILEEQARKLLSECEYNK